MKKLMFIMGTVMLVTSCCCVTKTLKHVKCVQHGEVVYDGPATKYFEYDDSITIRAINAAGEQTEQIIQGEVSCSKTYKKQEKKNEQEKEYYE